MRRCAMLKRCYDACYAIDYTYDAEVRQRVIIAAPAKIIRAVCVAAPRA